MNCSELWFTGTNGSTIFAKCLFPKEPRPLPTLFYFRGYQGQGPDWTELLKFTDGGLGVVAMECPRASGSFSGLGAI